MRLEGKVAVITGGASGMGRATALRFLDEGARVVIADLNESSAKESLDAAADAGHGKELRFIRTDVAEEPDVTGMIELAVSEFGRLDVLFNNAGVGGAFGPITDIKAEDWDYTFGVLLRGVFLGIKHGARQMKSQGQGGSIISTASVAGVGGGAGPTPYSAAKAGVINLTKNAAVELAAHRIRVNCICPGGILTPLVTRGLDPDSLAPMLDQLQPWPEHGRGEDIAGAALFLASDDARFVTGESLIVDGGLIAAGPALTTRMRGSAEGPFAGAAGVNRGSTGQEHTLRQVPG